MKTLTLIAVALCASFALAQDKPQDIAKKELPKEAECTVCVAQGTGEEAEKPAAGVMYKGKPYYFCSVKEVKVFKENPDFYLPLALPMPLPELGLVDTNGKLWNADAFKGKIVLIDYWATWCKPCHELKPKLDKVRDSYKEKGFELLSLSTDESKSTFEKFMAKKKWDNPVAHDSKGTWGDLKVIGIPALFLVKDGVVVAQFKGKIDVAEVEAAVKSHLP